MQWQDEFVGYLVERGFGAFYFGLNPESRDTGGILKKNWHSPEDAKLKLIARLPGTLLDTVITMAPYPPPTISPPPPHPAPSPPRAVASMGVVPGRSPPRPRQFPLPPWTEPVPPPPPWFPVRHIGWTPSDDRLDAQDPGLQETPYSYDLSRFDSDPLASAATRLQEGGAGTLIMTAGGGGDDTGYDDIGIMGSKTLGQASVQEIDNTGTVISWSLLLVAALGYVCFRYNPDFNMKVRQLMGKAPEAAHHDLERPVPAAVVTARPKGSQQKNPEPKQTARYGKLADEAPSVPRRKPKGDDASALSQKVQEQRRKSKADDVSASLLPKGNGARPREDAVKSSACFMPRRADADADALSSASLLPRKQRGGPPKKGRDGRRVAAAQEPECNEDSASVGSADGTEGSRDSEEGGRQSTSLPKAAPKGRPQRAPPPSCTALPPSGVKASASRSSELVAGTQVRVQGLVNAAHHNGKEGVIMGRQPNDNPERHTVRLRSGEILSLREANLDVAGRRPDLQAMIGALERAGEYEKAALLRNVQHGGAA